MADRTPAAPCRTLPRGWLLLVLPAALTTLILWKVPEWQVAPQRSRVAAETQLSATDRLLLDKELFQAENAARGTLALILGAAGLLLGLGAAWRRLDAGREARSHERFSQAVEQLASERGDGSPRTETRLGGIYALERIAAESDTEYWPVMEVLTAYLRESAVRTRADAANGKRRPTADVQAIIGVLGRRRASPGGVQRRLLDLREADLRGANLSGARLDGVILHGAWLAAADATGGVFTRANLREADLSACVLSGADLKGAALARANLAGARLNGADLRGADLSSANLSGADLWQANLRGCNLKDVDLRGADLSQADLQEAILWRANLQEAALTDTHLKETHLERANLSGATGLSWDQGKEAFTDENTILPDYLTLGRTRVPPPPPPEPASHVVVTPKKRTRAEEQAPAPAATNVVQLQEAIRTASRGQPQPATAEPAEPESKPPSKKLARPRRRHPALVGPPRPA